MNEDTILTLYERMFTIRNVENRIKIEYKNRNIRMAVHLSIGQEAIPVGILASARLTDCCLSTHRCHAHYLGKGGDLQAMVDELYGLNTGCSRGYGGSMHLFDKKVNMWGAGAIVAGSVPIAVGMGMALKQAGTDNVCISFAGDGATDEGVYYESLNLAALFDLPVLFVVENNGYSTITPTTNRQAAVDVIAKARSFGVDGMCVNGNDAVQVYETALHVMENIRKNHRPFLIEATTYRLCAHVGPGSDFGLGLRSEVELAEWQLREPLARLKIRLNEECLDAENLIASVEMSVLEKIDVAFESAKIRFDEVNKFTGLTAPKPPDPGRV